MCFGIKLIVTAAMYVLAAMPFFFGLNGGHGYTVHRGKKKLTSEKSKY